jgi:hypothetical protein
MLMRLPESGSLLATLANGLGRTITDGEGMAIEAVAEGQLVEALSALARGEIEYVILEEGDEFVQAAGEGAGPYALQFNPAGGAGLQDVPGGVSEAAMREALLAYRRGGTGWRRSFQWAAS